MNDLSIDPAILDFIGSRDTVLFIGAGFSLLPSDPDVPARDRKGLRETLKTQYHATLTRFHPNPDSISVEDLISVLLSHGISRHAIAETLRGFLASSEELVALESFALLRDLLTLRPDIFEAIVTTNWDKGIEESLRGIPGLLVNSIVTERDCLTKYDSSRLSILKIHGDIDNQESLVLSSEDFSHYEATHPRIIERLRLLFSAKFLVFLGYAARDENFKRIYNSLRNDLGAELRGGWIIAPRLEEPEILWAPTVNLTHVSVTSQSFLTAAVSHVAKVPFGSSRDTLLPKSSNSVRYESDVTLQSLARAVRQRYGLREVWVAQLRDLDRPNRGIGRVAAYYIESRCRSIRSLAIATGETMEALAESLDTDVFNHRLLIMPTITLLAGLRGFKDPSYIVQTLVSRFKPKTATYISLALPDEDYVAELLPHLTEKGRRSFIRVTRSVGLAEVARATQADVIVSSTRPPNWYGDKRIKRQRTIPLQWVSGEPDEETSAALKRSGVVSIHQMLLLDSQGSEVSRNSGERSLIQLTENICGPSVAQLREATAGSRKVIVVAAHIKKLPSVLAVLRARLCNILIVDTSLAAGLIK